MSPTEILKTHYIATSIVFTPWWNQRKSVSKTTRERMASAVQAQARSIGASKVVYNADIAAIAEINSLRQQTRDWWEANTLPYGQDAVRLLRKDDLTTFKAKLDDVQKVLALLAQNVQNARHLIIADAQERLHDAFSLGDYPLDLSTLYGVEVSFPNLRPSNELPKEVHDQQVKYLDAKIHEAAQLAQAAFTQQFAELVSALAERITPDADGKKKIFRDSAVGNLLEFFAQFEKLKLQAGDDLDQLVSQTKALIAGVTAQDLRDSDLLKKEIAAGLKTIEEGLTPLIVKAPRRMILKPTKPAEAPHGQALAPTPIPA